jgi:uncharacterized protein (DUF924 family)
MLRIAGRTMSPIRAFILRDASLRDAPQDEGRRHADIVRRFGRFPHRNRLPGCATTPEEQAFLDGGGFSG